MGMIGGGRGAFIGGVHRMAAALDGRIELVGGAFSSEPERSRLSGADLHLDPARVYDSYYDLIERESQLPEGERMDFIAIVTPNHLHYAPARLALKHGFHVICDKPLCLNVEEALELQSVVEETGRLFALTHNYTGYPMVKQARAMIRRGDLGAIRKVVVAYPQGWLSRALESTGHKQASWRLDPERSGAVGAMGDIGTHAENLLEYITGLQIDSLCADLTAVVPGRRLDDDGNVLLRFDNGAKGVLYASQIAAGEENDLHIRIYGEKGGLVWRQEEPNTLTALWLDQPKQLLRTGQPYTLPEAQAHIRTPPGHPEGFIEAFANIYRNFAACIQARLAGKEPHPIYTDFPTVADGVRGMQFIEAVVASSREEKWWKVGKA